MVKRELVRRAVQEFEQRFGTSPSPLVAVAPGRVNLIGEHTDYNDGFVLPMGIDRGVAVAFAPRIDDMLAARAAEFKEPRELSLAAFRRRAQTRPQQIGRRAGWFSYVAGVVWEMIRAGWPVAGIDLAIASDLPIGAGLSSSAALEMAVARALTAAAGVEWDPRTVARLAQRAEHAFAGVACGIMDQLSVGAAREGCALLVDCRSLEVHDVPFPPEARIVVFDSGVKRELASSAYNDRRGACQRAVTVLQAVDPAIRALRDVDETLLARAAPMLDPVVLRRAMHVVAENQRPKQMADALERNDLARAGRLMLESHASLRDLYEVSIPELDLLVELASARDGCFGARLTGAGFGGSVIALARLDAVEGLAADVSEAYERRAGRRASVFACVPSQGAALHAVPDEADA
jgi:galactokinase